MNKSQTLSLPKAVLFDLDGTLLDTAPDLAAAINRMRARRGLEPAPYESLRCVASQGSPGLLRVGFGVTLGEPGYKELVTEFLAEYKDAMTVQTRLFDGISELLEALKARGIRWGIVTNKIAQLTDPLVAQIGLNGAGCVISGDTTPHPKPHPEPVREAARRLGLLPVDCWFVGDDLRDVQSGRDAGAATIAAAWGYCVDTHVWDADRIAASPLDVLTMVETVGQNK